MDDIDDCALDLIEEAPTLDQFMAEFLEVDDSIYASDARYYAACKTELLPNTSVPGVLQTSIPHQEDCDCNRDASEARYSAACKTELPPNTSVPGVGVLQTSIPQEDCNRDSTSYSEPLGDPPAQWQIRHQATGEVRLTTGPVLAAELAQRICMRVPRTTVQRSPSTMSMTSWTSSDTT